MRYDYIGRLFRHVGWRLRSFTVYGPRAETSVVLITKVLGIRGFVMTQTNLAESSPDTLFGR